MITIHILPDISRSKGNQTMKLDQLIKYNKKNIFLQKLCRKWDRETSSRPFFQNSLMWGKTGGLELIVSIYFNSPQLGIQLNKNV